jgi:hypothetical protein
LPTLGLERRVDAIGEGDELIEIGLKVQQHELRVQLETEGVAEGCFEGEAAKIVGCTVQAPQSIGRRRQRNTARRWPHERWLVVVSGVALGSTLAH